MVSFANRLAVRAFSRVVLTIRVLLGLEVIPALERFERDLNRRALYRRAQHRRALYRRALYRRALYRRAQHRRVLRLNNVARPIRCVQRENEISPREWHVEITVKNFSNVYQCEPYAP